MATSSQEGSDASSSCKKKKKKARRGIIIIISYVVSGAKSICLISKAAPLEMHKFFHTWCFSWHASKYLLNLSSNSNWYSIFVYQINPVLLWHCTCSTADSPPLFCPHKCHKCWWHRFNKLPKKKKENVPPRPQSTRTWQRLGLPADLWADAMRLSGSARSQRGSIGLRWRPFWVHCHVQESTLRRLELCDTTRYPVGSSHQETVHGGHKGMDVVRNKTQVACRVWAMLTCY